MSRKKFDADIRKIEDYINIIESYSIKIVCKNVAEKISRDKDDNKILQYGLEGDVNFIITSDEDLLVLQKYKNNKPKGLFEYGRRCIKIAQSAHLIVEYPFAG